MSEEYFKCPKCGNEYLIDRVKGLEKDAIDTAKRYPGTKRKKVGNFLYFHNSVEWEKSDDVLNSNIIFACRCGYCSNYQNFNTKNYLPNNSISSLENEIKELKEKLNKAEKIIEKQNLEIQDLKNKLNIYKIINIKPNIQSNFHSNQNILQKEIMKENNNKYFADKCVNFISTDQKLFYAVPCPGNATFAEIEEKLYKEYPEYRETNNTFLANGKEILRFKTIDDNNIGNGKPVMLVKPT